MVPSPILENPLFAFLCPSVSPALQTNPIVASSELPSLLASAWEALAKGERTGERGRGHPDSDSSSAPSR